MSSKRVITDVGSRALYNAYKKDNLLKKVKGKPRGIIDRNSAYFITPKKYVEILEDYSRLIVEEIVYNNFEYKLPNRLGEISVKKQKLKFFKDADGKSSYLPIDWKATKDLWAIDKEAKENKKLVRHLNEHSDNFVARWVYNKNKAYFKNRTLYKFKPARQVKIFLAKAIKNESLNLNFYELPSKYNYIKNK